MDQNQFLFWYSLKLNYKYIKKKDFKGYMLFNRFKYFFYRCKQVGVFIRVCIMVIDYILECW